MLRDLAQAGGLHLVPPVAGTPLKIGDHSFSREGDPDEPDRAADPREVERIPAPARRRIPGPGGFGFLGAALGLRLARAIAHHEGPGALSAWAAGEERQPA